jgi:glucosamine--fructose-6-phosphate aminotransferase (isomerizing)
MEQSMLDEILEIPVRAKHFARESSSYALPVQVPYLGMGSSYFAALGLKYMGIAIFPELASEFYQYLSAGMKYPKSPLHEKCRAGNHPAICG